MIQNFTKKKHCLQEYRVGISMINPIKLRFLKKISKYQINSRRPTHKDRHDFHQGTRYCEIWNQRFERAILNCYIAELFLSDKSVTLINSLFKALRTINLSIFYFF